MKTVLDRAHGIVTVDDVLTRSECEELIAFAEKIGFEDAPITTFLGFVHRPEVRNNTRVMVDDVPRAKALWERIREYVPARCGAWRSVGLNERFRFYRYEPGQYFKWHFDGAFVRSPSEESLITVMLYLNEDMTGGATDFQGLGSVQPKTGKLLLFDHATCHQGAPVLSGRKYVLRTDVMFQDSRRA